MPRSFLEYITRWETVAHLLIPINLGASALWWFAIVRCCM